MADEQKRRGRPPKVKADEPREARNNAAVEGAEALAAPVAAPVVESAGDLAGYVESMERDGAVLVAITHPDATPGVYQGRYSGIRMSPGPKSATWSDGSKT